MSNYEKIIRDNLLKIYDPIHEELEKALPANREGDIFSFRAFGEDCRIAPEGITFSGKTATGPKALLISLYGVHANPDQVKLEPFKSFRDFPGSMPYQGAFTANSEWILVPHVGRIKEMRGIILKTLNGEKGPEDMGGDFSFLLYPLPKICLCYIFYLPDEEFPASATCLFSHNASSFMPLDGLADVAEYTSKAMISLLPGH